MKHFKGDVQRSTAFVKDCQNIVESIERLSKSDDTSFEIVDLGVYTNNNVDLVISKNCYGKELEVDKEGINQNIHVELDNEQFKIVLSNLIMNAFHAMGEKEFKKINVSVYKKNNRGIVELADNGCGMSAEEKEKAFEVLYTTKSRGWGLGLAMCQLIMENHDGKIWCDSVKGEGSSFYIGFPIACDDAVGDGV